MARFAIPVIEDYDNCWFGGLKCENEKNAVWVFDEANQENAFKVCQKHFVEQTKKGGELEDVILMTAYKPTLQILRETEQ